MKKEKSIKFQGRVGWLRQTKNLKGCELPTNAKRRLDGDLPLFEPFDELQM
jgi:hypothetical protein